MGVQASRAEVGRLFDLTARRRSFISRQRIHGHGASQTHTSGALSTSVWAGTASVRTMSEKGELCRNTSTAIINSGPKEGPSRTVNYARTDLKTPAQPVVPCRRPQALHIHSGIATNHRHKWLPYMAGRPTLVPDVAQVALDRALVATGATAGCGRT